MSPAHSEPPRGPYPIPRDDHALLASGTFRLLADATRVKLLWALLQEERNVNALAEAVDAPASTVSRHLAKLRAAGLVETRRDGTFVHYRATDAHVHRLLAEALSHAEHVTGDARGADPHGYTAPPARR